MNCEAPENAVDMDAEAVQDAVETPDNEQGSNSYCSSLPFSFVSLFFLVTHIFIVSPISDGNSTLIAELGSSHPQDQDPNPPRRSTQPK